MKRFKKLRISINRILFNHRWVHNVSQIDHKTQGDNKMITMYNATYVRKNWSQIITNAVVKPQFFKRKNDTLIILDVKLLEELLIEYKFTAVKIIEQDFSCTLSLNEIDLVENAENEKDAKLNLAESILQYAKDYYDEFNFWSSSINRKKHIPYILLALAIKDISVISNLIEC